MIRSVATPIVCLAIILGFLAYVLAPRVSQGLRGLRDSHGGRLIRDAMAEIAEWRRRRRNPRPVAAFTDPNEDESLWLRTLPLEHVVRLGGTVQRMYRKGRLRGENIATKRRVRQELRRRLVAAESPNRAVMDQLSDEQRRHIQKELSPKEAGQ